MTKVLANHVLQALGNDLFIKGLVNAESHRNKLELALTQLHSNIKSAMETQVWQDLELRGKDVFDIFERIHVIVKGLLGLLLPSPETQGVGAKDSMMLLNYKGSSTMEGSIQGVLLETPFWVKLTEDTNKKAGSSKEQWPILKNCLEASREAANLGVQPEKWLTTLAEILPKLDQLKEGLKFNATKDLEMLLADMLPAVIKFITSAQTATQFNPDHVTIIAENLYHFPSSRLAELGLTSRDAISDFGEFKEKLLTWQTKMQNHIATVKLQDIMGQFDGKAVEDIEMNWDEFARNVVGLPDIPESLQESLQPKLITLMYIMVRDLEREAGL